MAVTSKIAPAQQPLPLGWNYSYLNDGFTGPNGEFISRDMVQTHGSFHKAFAYMYGAQTGAIGAINNGSYATINQAVHSAGSLSALNDPATLEIQGKLGTIKINLDTGELTMPPNVGRDAAIRDFWLGFQENFQPTNKAKYEQQIKDLQLQVAQVQASAALMKKDDEKEGRKKVAERIAKKYNGEKFIMVKPEDLIRFIESE